MTGFFVEAAGWHGAIPSAALDVIGTPIAAAALARIAGRRRGERI